MFITKYSPQALKIEAGTAILLNISCCICLIILAFISVASWSEKCLVMHASADHLLSNISVQFSWNRYIYFADSIRTSMSSSDSYVFDSMLILFGFSAAPIVGH